MRALSESVARLGVVRKIEGAELSNGLIGVGVCALAGAGSDRGQDIRHVVIGMRDMPGLMRRQTEDEAMPRRQSRRVNLAFIGKARKGNSGLKARGGAAKAAISAARPMPIDMPVSLPSVTLTLAPRSMSAHGRWLSPRRPARPYRRSDVLRRAAPLIPPNWT